MNDGSPGRQPTLRHRTRSGKTGRHFLEMAGRTFKKRGRPADDRVARRLEIFRAVAPELERVGPRGLTMQRAAELAFMSVGSLYYWFEDKRSLVMYGLDPEPAGLICREFIGAQPDQPFEVSDRASAVVDLIIDTLRLMRASATAVIEAGPDVVSERLEAVVHRPIVEFEELLDAVELGEAREGGSLEPVVRRFVASAIFEPVLVPDDLRHQLEALFGAGQAHPGVMASSSPSPGRPSIKDESA